MPAERCGLRADSGWQKGVRAAGWRAAGPSPNTFLMKTSTTHGQGRGRGWIPLPWSKNPNPPPYRGRKITPYPQQEQTLFKLQRLAALTRSLNIKNPLFRKQGIPFQREVWMRRRVTTHCSIMSD